MLAAHLLAALTMVVIAALCGVIIILSIVAAILDALTRREMRNRARHIVVASATFDEFGKILVKHDGTIPMQMIETEADLNVRDLLH